MTCSLSSFIHYSWEQTYNGYIHNFSYANSIGVMLMMVRSKLVIGTFKMAESKLEILFTPLVHNIV